MRQHEKPMNTTTMLDISKCGMIILFTTTTTITAVCVVVVDNAIYFSDITIGTTTGD